MTERKKVDEDQLDRGREAIAEAKLAAREYEESEPSPAPNSERALNDGVPREPRR